MSVDWWRIHLLKWPSRAWHIWQACKWANPHLLLFMSRWNHRTCLSHWKRREMTVRHSLFRSNNTSFDQEKGFNFHTKPTHHQMKTSSVPRVWDVDDGRQNQFESFALKWKSVWWEFMAKTFELQATVTLPASPVWIRTTFNSIKSETMAQVMNKIIIWSISAACSWLKWRRNVPGCTQPNWMALFRTRSDDNNAK